MIKSLYYEYNSRYIISTIKMLIATSLANYKFVNEKMLTAPLLAKYKLVGEKIIIIGMGSYKNRSPIIWFVPISTKYDKYEKIYNYKKQKLHRVYNFVFGEVVGKKAVFLIQNIFPTTEEYILEKYITDNKDVEIALNVRNKVIAYANQIINMAKNGINIPFYDINKMKDILLNMV